MSWFPEKDDPELERLADLVFELRRKLFLVTEFRRKQPMMRESEEQERQREERNEEAIRQWDNETRRMILGEATETT